MSDTPEIIACPHCGGKLRVPSLTSSRNIQCGHCKQPFEYHPDGIADATILEHVQAATTEGIKAGEGSEGGLLIGIVAAVISVLTAWFFAGMPRMDGISDVARWAAITFSWQMLIMFVLAIVVAVVSALVLIFILGMFFSKYESVLHNLMFGLILGIPLGVAASPMLAWAGNGTEWRTALTTTIIKPKHSELGQSDVQDDAIGQGSGKQKINTDNAKNKNAVSAEQKTSQGSTVSNSNDEPPSRRPTSEPFASCYDLWENVTYEIDSYSGHSRYPFDAAEAIEKQYPACFFRSTKYTSWTFPRFELGPKAAAVRPQICLDLARNYYYLVLDKKQSKRTFTADPTINAAFLSEYQEKTGAYCFKPKGAPHFAIDKGSRPQPYPRDRCNSTAKAYAARVESQDKIEALCFNSDGSPIFDGSLFADEQGRNNALYAECARNFEPYAKAFLDSLGPGGNVSDEDLMFVTMGNLDVFERNNKLCFKQIDNYTTALFPLSGPYARDYRIWAYYHQ